MTLPRLFAECQYTCGRKNYSDGTYPTSCYRGSHNSPSRQRNSILRIHEVARRPPMRRLGSTTTSSLGDGGRLCSTLWRKLCFDCGLTTYLWAARPSESLDHVLSRFKRSQAVCVCYLYYFFCYQISHAVSLLLYFRSSSHKFVRAFKP